MRLQEGDNRRREKHLLHKHRTRESRPAVSFSFSSAVKTFPEDLAAEAAACGRPVCAPPSWRRLS